MTVEENEQCGQRCVLQEKRGQEDTHQSRHAEKIIHVPSKAKGIAFVGSIGRQQAQAQCQSRQDGQQDGQNDRAGLADRVHDCKGAMMINDSNE